MAEPVQKASILSVRDLSPAVRELIVSPRERHLHFAPGQWVSLKLPVGPRPPLVRAYSMAAPESPTGEVVLVFDRVPGGLGSTYLVTLKPGDTLSISGPHGNFCLPESVGKDVLFVARFTGIVPIRCMLLDLIKPRQPAGAVRGITLLYAAPTTDFIYDSEFRELAESHSHVRYVPVGLDPHPGEATPLEKDTLRRVIGERRDLYPMLAGIKAFVRPLRAMMMEMGFERREIRQETYD
jgi:NAD(P)H-flavin reductase